MLSQCCKASAVAPAQRTLALPAPTRPRRRPAARPTQQRLYPCAALPPFLGGSGGEKEGDPDEFEHHPGDRAAGVAGAAADIAQAGETEALRTDVEDLKHRMDQIQAALDALNDRARERAVSMVEAVRSAVGERTSEASTETLTNLQHQQDEQLHDDEKSWDNLMDTFTQVMSKGYIQSVEKIRDRLLITEWELGRKAGAIRRGVSRFELHCATERVDLPYDVLTSLYEEPDNLEVIGDAHLRMQARACIHSAVDEEYGKAWAHCTAEAQKLAQQFSQSEFISKLLPESGILDALKKVVPMALKLVV